MLFVVWYRVEGTLSIHSITTRRRELFYWAVVMATFALGTAAGDFTAFSLGWGFFASAVLFAALFGFAFAATALARIGEVAAFWFAYVVTRPLGASLADLFAGPKELGGLGYGYGTRERGAPDRDRGVRRLPRDRPAERGDDRRDPGRRAVSRRARPA